MAKVRNSILLWNALSPKEKKKFEYWLTLQCPHADSQELKVLRALKKAKTQKVDAAIADAFAIPIENDDYLRTLNSRLTKKLKAFLNLIAAKKRGMGNSFLLEELNERKLHELLEKEYKQARKALELHPARTAEYYEKLYRLEAEWQRYLLTHKPKGKKVPFSGASEAFDLWWIHGKLSHACIAISHEKMRKETTKDYLLEEVLQLVETHPDFRHQEVLQFYLAFYKFLKGNPAISLNQIRQAINQLFPLFEKDEKHNVCTLLISHLLRQLRNRDRTIKPKPVIDFYAWTIDQKAVLTGKHLSWVHFRNLITLCLKYNYLPEARGYLDAYQKLLPEANRKEFYTYCQGLLLFHEKKYAQSRRCLFPKFSHPLLNHPAKLVYLQSCYEDNFLSPEELATALNKLEKQMAEDQHPAFLSIQSFYLNKALFFGRMLTCKKQTDYRNLMRDIGKCEQVADKEWLIEKTGAQALL